MYNNPAAFPPNPEDGQIAVWREAEGAWVAENIPTPSGSVSLDTEVLDALISVEVVGPQTFEGMAGMNVGFNDITSQEKFNCLLVVNSGNNNGFAVGIRVTYSTDGETWLEVPGASLVDVDSTINRAHLTVLGQLTGITSNELDFRAEWTAFGDSGTWTIDGSSGGEGSQGACLQVIRS